VRRSVAAAVTFLALAVCGCGGDGDGGNRPTEQKSLPTLVIHAAEGMSAWSDAATSYNSILQGCRQPYPTRGYVAACTGEWRHKYDQATRRLLGRLRAPRPSSPTCGHALAQSRSLVREVTKILRQAFGSYSALLDNRTYRGSRVRGPTVMSLLREADSVTKRNTKLAVRARTAIRESCLA
jgi:hypothetical protein